MSEVFVEHIVKRKADFKTVLFRILAVLLTVLVFFFGTMFLGMLGITITILIGYLAYLVFVYTSVEYEYSLVNGELTIEKIMGQRKRKFANEFDLKNAEIIAPTFSEEIQNKKTVLLLDYSSGNRSDALYSIILTDKEGSTQVLFEPTEKMLDAMLHVRPNIVKKKV